MRKWAGAAALLALLVILWLLREPATARAPGPRPGEHPAAGGGAEVAPSGPASSEPQMALRGVVEDDDGRPIAGALVQLRTGIADGPEARTGDDGTFAFERALPSEAYYVVTASGYAGRGVEAGTERIVLRRGTLRVRARLVDEEGRPVEGATGEAFFDEAYGRSVSDSLGRLEIGGLFPYGDEPGGLLVRAKGYAPSPLQLEPLEEDIDAGTVVLSRGGVVTGVVRDEETGGPVPGAHVAVEAHLWDGTVLSGADGSFRLEGVPLDAAWIYAHGDGWLPSRKGFGPAMWERRVFFDEEREIVRDVLVARSVTVRGTVLDAAGAPVANASVRVTEEEESPRSVVPGIDWRAATDAKGAFAVKGFHACSALMVEAETESGVASSKGRAGEPLVLRLEPTRRVVGRVLNGRGEPAPDVEVTIGPATREEEAGPSDAGWAKGDGEGRFALRHVRHGTWSLVVEAKGLVTLSTTVDVGPGQGEIDLGDIILGSGSFLAGVVVDETGAPLEGAGVSASSDEEREGGGRFGRARTDAMGRFRIEGLCDGEFEVDVWKRGRWRTQVVAAAGSADLRIVVPRALSARGRVLRGGTPLPDARVDAIGGEAGEVAEDGTFTVTELQPGRPFTLRIMHALHKTLAHELEPWEGVRDFRLVEGRFFEGTVVDERGRPIPEMSVHVSTEGNDDDKTVESDADGRFRVGGLEEGQIVVQLWPGKGYVHEGPVSIAPGVASCQLVARRGYEARGTVRRKDKSAVEHASVTVFREDGTEVRAVPTWYGRGRFSTEELAPGKYRLVARGYSKGPGGALEEHYGEAAVEITVPGPDVEIVLPK